MQERLLVSTPIIPFSTSCLERPSHLEVAIRQIYDLEFGHKVLFKLMSSTSFVSQHVLQRIQVIWNTNTIIWWSSSWGHTNEGSFRHLSTNDTWAWYKSYSNHIFNCTMLKSSPRWSKWTLGWPNSESGWKSYASGKITDSALSGQAVWLRPAGLVPPSKHSPLSVMALETHH